MGSLLCKMKNAFKIKWVVSTLRRTLQAEIYQPTQKQQNREHQSFYITASSLNLGVAVNNTFY